MSAGKGDKPRNCFSKSFQNNYDFIDWGKIKICRKCHSKMKQNFTTCPSCGYENKVNSER